MNGRDRAQGGQSISDRISDLMFLIFFLIFFDFFSSNVVLVRFEVQVPTNRPRQRISVAPIFRCPSMRTAMLLIELWPEG